MQQQPAQQQPHQLRVPPGQARPHHRLLLHLRPDQLLHEGEQVLHAGELLAPRPLPHHPRALLQRGVQLHQYPTQVRLLGASATMSSIGFLHSNTYGPKKEKVQVGTVPVIKKVTVFIF